MYCTKCGKKAASGDVYCSGCGSKLGSGAKTQNKKGSSWILILLCAAVLIFAASKMMGQKEDSGLTSFEPEKERESITLQEAQVNTGEMLPEEPKDGDLLEDSSYANGNPRREVSDYSGTVYVTDYRPDGNLLRETTLTYINAGEFGGIRVTNYDEYGNPTDTTQSLADGELELYLYYENTYDDQGRPLRLAEFNRMGNPLCIYSYTYNSDGTYTMECTEYRGFVYEYDLPYHPQGTTSLWAHSVTTFNASGEPVDQYITMMDGSPVE